MRIHRHKHKNILPLLYIHLCTYARTQAHTQAYLYSHNTHGGACTRRRSRTQNLTDTLIHLDEVLTQAHVYKHARAHTHAHICI